ncbi:hypothetical protein AUR64_02635 [Haloprofundus marisrubri]|uniref:Major facilitator superfamily (MFS) profile domain-containing protein n=1 Tax=Haloprofundus marisrubri TaxID=1514971 RepID=A0A0W1R3F0_9EURY|nr:MFS transporter [Haloprofundus marisrubri]KTG07755.1 hypothetical protein AUR64_02635 [Haloprofundus marisrubri]
MRPVSTVRRALRLPGIGVLLTVSAGWFLTLGMRFVVPALLPTISADFGLSNAAAGFAVSVVWAGYAIMQFPAGMVADRVDERTLLVTSLCLAGGSLVVLAGAINYELFLVACGLFGLATGLYGPPRGMLLSRTFTRRSGAMFGIALASGSVGAALLPFVAVAAAGVTGWRPSFLVFVAPFVLVAVGLARAVPRRTESSGSTRTLLSVGQWRAVVRALVVTRARVVVPAVSLMIFGFQAITAFLPLYLVAEKGFDAAQAALLYGMLFASAAVVQPLAGTLADRFGEQRTLVTTCAVSIVPLVSIPFLDDVVPLALAIVALGVREGVVPISNALTIAALPEDVRGSSWGLARTLFMGFASMGSVVVGVFGDYGRFDEAFFLLAALTVVSVLLYATLPSE